MKVKEQKKINFANDCGANVDCEDLEQAIIWYSDKKVVEVKHIFINGSYPAISIHGENSIYTDY